MISSKLTGAAYSAAATSRLEKPTTVSNSAQGRDPLRKAEARKEDSVVLSRGKEEPKPATYTREGLMKSAKKEELDSTNKVDKREVELKAREERDGSKRTNDANDAPDLRKDIIIPDQRSERGSARVAAATERASVAEAEKMAARPEAKKSDEAEIRDAAKRQAAEGKRKIEVRA